MQITRRIVFPFAPPAEPVDIALERPERGVYAIVHYASKLVHTRALGAAARGMHAYLAQNPDVAPGVAPLRALVDRMARATRQAGEILAQPRSADADVATVDGAGFVPDPRSHALGFMLELAVVWLDQREAYLATIGRCAAILVRGGALEPLHALDTLRQVNPNAPEELGRWVPARALCLDPNDLCAGLAVRHVALEPGERLALLSPSMAVPVVEMGERPSSPLEGAEALADWLESPLRRHPPRDPKAVGAALLLSPE